MDKNQQTTELKQPTELQQRTEPMDQNQEFHVTFFDSHCGRIRTEVFDDLRTAERFASRSVCEEDDWAVIDAVPVQQQRLAA
jgi:hypothetical protein